VSRGPCRSCHGGRGRGGAPGAALRVALVGAPNVGKSALFHRLTGRYVVVSNFPGTTVEVARGAARMDGVWAEVVDTPGVYALEGEGEVERVTRALLESGAADVIVHVADAKDLARHLPLTLQLRARGLPVVLALNMMDEAERWGVRVDAEALARRLGCPVVPVVAVEGRGVGALREAVADAARRALCRRGQAVAGGSGECADGGYAGAVARRRAAEAILAGIVTENGRRAPGGGERLGRALAHPVTGLPLLAAILYVGLYGFVGRFGAGTLVDAIEGGLFEGVLNPWLERAFAPVPWAPVRDLFVGEYGLLTLGLRYAIGIILPIVGTFFLFFSVLEDSGAFPRVALLVDRVFKRLGLSGRAVIPMVLGFACDTMATMVTRTLSTRRERVLATLLLALAVPCSAQLGVILAVLSPHPGALAVWGGVVLVTFGVVGALAARVLPGDPPLFHMELPPLRRPRLGNVLAKTAARMHWYLAEVLPLFLWASVVLWAGAWTGAFDAVVRAMAPAVGALGLPAAAARVFLFGFFRRDYGAAGLFDLHRANMLDPAQLTVAAVTLTLFLPCIAQFLVMWRERGPRTALAILGFVTPFAFGVGWLVHEVSRWLGL
jgi:ferrous iron transport protein B